MSVWSIFTGDDKDHPFVVVPISKVYKDFYILNIKTFFLNPLNDKNLNSSIPVFMIK
jgi:hypothetical protein